MGMSVKDLRTTGSERMVRKGVKYQEMSKNSRIKERRPANICESPASFESLRTL